MSLVVARGVAWVEWARGRAAVRRGYERAASGFESGVQLLERRYTPLGRFTPGPFEGWGFLWQPAVLGFVALTLDPRRVRRSPTRPSSST